MNHSLSEFDHLKVDPGNMLSFDFQNSEERIITVQHESKRMVGLEFETSIEDIYQVKILQITLRQLLLFESLYFCKSTGDIIDLVND